MNEPQDTDQAPATAQYLRLPVPVIAGALVVLLVVLLWLGLYANSNLRPQGIIVPAVVATSAAPATAPAPTPVPLAVGTVTQPQALRTAQSTATPALAASSSATPAPVATEARTSLTITAAQPEMPTAAPAQSAITEVPTTTATVEPTLAAEIGQAYENFWRVKSQALLELDSTHLSEVMAGEYLSDTQDLLDELRTENRAIKTQVSLNYSVVNASNQMAMLVDYFTDDSVYVTIGTEQPLSSPVGEQLGVLYRLEKISDVWKVVKSVRSP